MACSVKWENAEFLPLLPCHPLGTSIIIFRLFTRCIYRSILNYRYTLLWHKVVFDQLPFSIHSQLLLFGTPGIHIYQLDKLPQEITLFPPRWSGSHLSSVRLMDSVYRPCPLALCARRTSSQPLWWIVSFSSWYRYKVINRFDVP